MQFLSLGGSSLKYVDAHCHIAEYKDPDIVINEAITKGVDIIIGVGDNPASNAKLLSIACKYPNVVKPCLGFHPWDAPSASNEDIKMFKEQIKKNIDQIYGIGEVGLDKRFVKGEDKFKKQMKIFKIAIELAKEYELPLNIHTVKTERIAFELLIKEDISKALFHWYTGSYEVLNQIISVGYRVSVNLSLMYSKRSRGVAERTPLALLLLESDSPYEFRGEVASPLSVCKVASLLANIKHVSIDVIAKVTTRNATIFFSI